MKWVFLAVALAYPLLVYAGLAWVDARWIGLAVAACLMARLFAAREKLVRERRALLVPGVGLLAIALLLLAGSGDPVWLFLLPAFVNAALFATFAVSLRRPPCVVETLARLQAGELSAAEVAYCRAVTRLWCGFFVLNGAVIAWLALAGSPSAWAAYTGGLAYVLVGALFAAEYVYRHYRFRRYLGAVTDPLLRKLFPPREAPGGPG